MSLRLAGQLAGSVDADGLVAALADRAHFANAADLVGELAARGLLEDGRLSSSGSELLGAVQARIARDTAPIWGDLPAADVDATVRTLNEIIGRARHVLER